jgi:hypothetical protein
MKIKTYVFAKRTSPNRHLTRWLTNNQVDWEYGSEEWGIDVARNQTCIRFMRECPDYTHMIMLDCDIVPDASMSDFLLDPDEDIMWASYVGRGSEGHVDTFGAGACRISAGVLRKLSESYRMPFRFTYNETADRLLDCECNHFAREATALGYVPKQVGCVGHILPVVWYPKDGGRVHVMPHELDAGQLVESQ